jgi:Transmembrane domain of unknown function (DUF3566)
MSANPENMDPRPERGTSRQTRTRPSAEPTAPTPSGDGQPPPPQARPSRVPRSARTAPAPGPRAPRRVRHTIKKVDLWSALKISLCFYVCEMAVIVTSIAFLWLVADAFGVIGSVEKFIGDLLSSNDFHFLSAGMLRGVVLVGLVLVAIQVVATVLACAFYNLFAELFGGIEVTVIQEDAPGKR